MIIFVAAHGKNNEMGFKGRLPWPPMRADMRHLHELANGKTVVMGERTLHNYTDVNKSYQTKRVIVLSRSEQKKVPGVEVVHDIEEIIELSKSEGLCVVGGASIFSHLLAYAEQMYLTEIDGEFEADTFFPKYSHAEWKVVEKTTHPSNEDNPYPYSFVTLKRRSFLT